MVQNGSSNVRNGKANKFSDILHPILCKSDETKTSKFCYSASFFHLESAYKMETFELSCTRLPHDRTAGRVKYFLQKDNRVMFIIAKNREDNEFSCSHHVSPKPCSNDSFSMNETYVSFKLRNITLQDAGRYVCLKYSPGLYNLTSEEIDLNVLGKVFKHVLMIY